ncbi:MAG: ATP-binding protein [Ardenticatenales bacterium]|nr:ATP-binding protein [Ardenticatenales bacterium]
MSMLEEGEALLFRELRSISVDAAGAMMARTRAAREKLLRTLVERLQKERIALGRSDRARLHGHAEGLAQWQHVLEAEAKSVAQQREAAGEIPMRYSAGAVLERGAAAFQGRDDLFRTLEGLLINQPSKITPLLLGQPRTGKSSVLKQLPVRLGAQVLPVYLDMERRASADTAASLLGDIVGVIQREAQSHPQPLSLPPLDKQGLAAEPYRVFENWIEEVERALGEGRWLLLALDEFNRIDEAVRAGRMDERIFFLLRSLIQHHPQVALALSGTFALDECDPRWYDTLKSVRNLPVTFLRPDEAERVFTKPAPGFPDGVYSEVAIERALSLTGGQPFLIHLLGETLVNRYNYERTTVAPGTPPGLPLPVSAIDAALPEVLTGGETFFVSLWQWLLRISQDEPGMAALLSALAKGQPLDNIGSSEEREELLGLFVERDLLAPDEAGGYTFRVPLIAEWIRQQRRLPTLR